MRLQFWGATRTVTGSKHALFFGERVVLVDCGLYQGLKPLRLRNWEKLPLTARRISDVIVTHAHIDHTGYLPRLVKDGFRGRIWATGATAELMRIVLPDTGHLQEEDAAYANRKGYSRHRPALPLFTRDDAVRVFPYLRTVDYGQDIDLEVARFRLFDAGHILGSSFCQLTAADSGRRILFSGDIGRPDALVVQHPAPPPASDYVVFESTYGDRVREDVSPADELSDAIREAVTRGGAIVIPAFAVERTQELLFLLDVLIGEGRIPRLPIYLDSPMGIEVLRVFDRHPELLALTANGRGHTLLDTPGLHVAATIDASKAINEVRPPHVIISSSGMATGGRVLHHLQRHLPDPRATVILVGYQAAGTRGRQLQEGQDSIRIYGRDVEVRAAVRVVRGLSGHADADDLLAWLGAMPAKPKRAFVVHGEAPAAEALATRVRRELGWDVTVPDYLDRFDLNAD